LAVLLILTVSAWAQNTAPHNHSVKMLNGSDNPDNIPDALAKRLILLDVALPANPTDEDRRRQASIIAKIRLDVNDIQPFLNGVAYFALAHDTLVKPFNEAATKADDEGAITDQKGFYVRLDRLVDSTWTAIEGSLSVVGVSRLDAYLANEKKFMARTDDGGGQ
jgi:hypothetical protein